MQETKIKDFQDQYKSLKGPFMRYATALLKDSALAEEIVHEAFLSAYSKWDTFQQKSKRSTWLWSILRNACLQHFRRSEFKYESVSEDSLENTPSSDEGAEMKLIQMSEEAVVKEALGLLTPLQREVVELRMSGLSMEEMSEILNTPSSTVKSHLHRAKKHLIKTLQGETNE